MFYRTRSLSQESLNARYPSLRVTDAQKKYNVSHICNLKYSSDRHMRRIRKKEVKLMLIMFYSVQSSHCYFIMSSI